MRVASGNPSFFLEHAEFSRKSYIDHLNTVSPAAAQHNLEQMVAQETPENQNALRKLSDSL
jgi:hypothetical protein